MRSAAAASTTPHPSDSAIAASFFKRPGSLPGSDYTRRVATDQALGILASRLQKLQPLDDASGYRTKSVLATPLRTPNGHIIGVLQLINAKTDRAARLGSETAVAAHVTTYSAGLDALAASLASQAAVALENSQLWAEIQQ